MSILQDILKEEKIRLTALKQKYEKELEKLPRGSLSKKLRNNKPYYYLAYRDGEKVKFQYIGKEDSEKLHILQKQVSKRHGLILKLKQVNEELKELSKSVNE